MRTALLGTLLIACVAASAHAEESTEAAKAEPAKTEAAKAEAAKAQAVKAAKAKAAKADATKADATKAEAAKTDAAKPDSKKAEAAKTDAAKPDSKKAEPTKADAAKPDSKKAEPTKADAAKPDSKKAEPTKADAKNAEPKKADAKNADAKKAAAPPVEEPLEPGVLDPKRIRTLTNDPVLGKADRVDGDETHGVVAFTFDDGPNPETTPAVIDALEKYNIPATFFIVTRRLVGKNGAEPRAILERILKAGFEIGSHSVSHPNLKKATPAKLDIEIDGSIKTLAPQANRAIGLFRPPFGAFGGAGNARLKKLGLTDVRWSVDTLDWQAKNAEKLRKKVLTMIIKQRGGVVLMHDVKPITAHIIAGVLDDLEAENCRRLAANAEPIVPVSLHYFLKDGKTARAIPEPVLKRTAAYRTALPGRCAVRPPPPPPPPPPTPATPTVKPAPATTPAK